MKSYLKSTVRSKLIHCEWNAFYFIEIPFIGFTLHEIKQCIVFFSTPDIMYFLNITILRKTRLPIETD